MVKNSIKTGKSVSSIASKQLSSPNSSKDVKKVSGSALANAKAKTTQKKK
jgi:hypothetical protein